MNKTYLIAGAFMLFLAFTLPVIVDMGATVVYEAAEIDGQFYINGELATTTSTHTVTSPDLNLKFVATSNGHLIRQVTVTPHVTPLGSQDQVVLTETVPDTEWEGIVTLLHGIGTYELMGIITHDETGDTFVKMSMSLDWDGSTGTATGQPLEEELQLNFAQVGFGILGLLLIVAGLLTGKKKKRW